MTNKSKDKNTNRETGEYIDNHTEKYTDRKERKSAIWQTNNPIITMTTFNVKLAKKDY